jgi:folylpolyglutamate synthase/dihydropteroate synthase
VIFGMLNNKKAFEFLSIIKKNIDILYPIQIPDEKNAYTQKEIYKVSKKINLKTVIVSNLSTINRLLINSSNKYILVTGSLYLIGKIRKKYL